MTATILPFPALHRDTRGEPVCGLAVRLEFLCGEEWRTFWPAVTNLGYFDPQGP